MALWSALPSAIRSRVQPLAELLVLAQEWRLERVCKIRKTDIGLRRSSKCSVGETT